MRHRDPHDDPPRRRRPTVVARDGRNELVPMRWGLIPSCWKKKAKEAPPR